MSDYVIRSHAIKSHIAIRSCNYICW